VGTMSGTGENEAQMRLCLEAPLDLDRLLVYADWLEERRDARGTDATYQGFTYARLPPLPVERFDGRGDDMYGPVLAGAPEFPEEESPVRTPYLSFPDLTFNAPTIESFVYRWWLENHIWYVVNGMADEARSLTPEEQAYLDHLGPE